MPAIRSWSAEDPVESSRWRQTPSLPGSLPASSKQPTCNTSSISSLESFQSTALFDEVSFYSCCRKTPELARSVALPTLKISPYLTLYHQVHPLRTNERALLFFERCFAICGACNDPAEKRRSEGGKHSLFLYLLTISSTVKVYMFSSQF